ncbi:MAG: DUF4760 domain-containing protein [Owenweeksia sp.]
MDKLNININIKYIILTLGLIILVTVSLIHWYEFKNLQDLIGISGTGVAILSLIYLAINTHVIIDQLSENRLLERQKTTVKLLEYTYSADYMNDAIDLSITWDSLKDKEQKEKLEYYLANRDIKLKLFRSLNYDEYCSYLCNNGIIDKELFLDYLGEGIEADYIKYKFIIDHLRYKSMNKKIFSEMSELVENYRRIYK